MRDRISDSAVARGLKFSLRDFASDFVVRWKTGDDAPVSIEESSGNVFADLRLKNPEKLLAKSWLVQRIPFLNGKRHQCTIDCAS
jgi:hypothetical protein